LNFTFSLPPLFSHFLRNSHLYSTWSGQPRILFHQLLKFESTSHAYEGFYGSAGLRNDGYQVDGRRVTCSRDEENWLVRPNDNETNDKIRTISMEERNNTISSYYVIVFLKYNLFPRLEDFRAFRDYVQFLLTCFLVHMYYGCMDCCIL
jgi:hypothetical protein